ncbi:ArsR/SmtB family transcription factor [Halosimplex aquaticum]|uniref:ArsR/SmtB family transcription factor n=1 Tax=Halosimplex aquaticum TaxID=3026162 RepID=A0ABD5XYJ9_9EURY|nr:winged helix-turn-helix domain-containing protein [Halosimplex aquaticum]
MTDSVDDPAEAFDVLSDETRLDILRALADADGPLPFSRLRERAGIRDSGRFSYHLRRLCEYFVRETDEGYALGHAGSRVVAATATAAEAAEPQDEAAEPAEIDECPVCGAEDCERLFHVHLSPPWRGD